MAIAFLATALGARTAEAQSSEIQSTEPQQEVEERARSTQAVASELARMVAFEEACGLAFNRSRIASFVRENVPPDDLSFNGLFNFLVGVRTRELRTISATALAIQCARIEIQGLHFGFINAEP